MRELNLKMTRTQYAFESNAALRYAFSIFAVLAAVLVRILLRDQLGTQLAFVTFYPAVFVAAVVGGLMPGLFATFFSAVAADYLVMLPVGSFFIARKSDAIGMGVFVITGSCISVLSESRRRTQIQADASNERLRLEVIERKRADGKNALLAAIVSSSDLAIVSQALNGTIMSWNSGAQSIFGYTAGEAIGRDIRLIIPAEDLENETEILSRVRQGELMEHIETERVHKDGHHIQVSLSVSPVRDASGAVIGGSKILRDIGDRKQAEEQFRLVVESAPNAMVLIGKDGHIALINTQTELLFGYRRDELLGQPVEILLPERFRKSHPGHRMAFFAKPAGVGPSVRSMGLGRDLYARRKDGGEFPIEVGLNPIQVKHETMVLSAIVDISERKREAERIRLFNEKLEILVQERTAQLRAANQELEQFAYAASHDLKAPLRVIENCSKWIEEDLEEHLSGETREHITMLRGRVRRMNKLLDDLLEYARIGSSTDARQVGTIAGDALMRNIGELLAPTGIVIRVSPSFARIQVRVMPLQQVLMNLIGNAIKHHDKSQGCIEVTTEDRGAFYAFAVKDDGPGIPARFHQQIFKMFQTLRPKDQIEGSGMGLAMVRKHVELRGGTIVLESSEGMGSTFRFTWPKDQFTPVERAEQSVQLSTA